MRSIQTNDPTRDTPTYLTVGKTAVQDTEVVVSTRTALFSSNKS